MAVNLIIAGITVVHIAAYKWVTHLDLAVLAEVLGALDDLADLADADFSHSDSSRNL
ncbi:hypothetical protein [Sporomusa aerivorans]|uniref:hypothetical protein n=1 Tax=Sporomusa aerivorans TaxID=204936 RepID=UPI00352B71A3